MNSPTLTESIIAHGKIVNRRYYPRVIYEVRQATGTQYAVVHHEFRPGTAQVLSMCDNLQGAIDSIKGRWPWFPSWG